LANSGKSETWNELQHSGVLVFARPACLVRMFLDGVMHPRLPRERAMFTDGRMEVTYRCETCGTETKRIIKDR
jgi:hypothetical protein